MQIQQRVLRLAAAAGVTAFLVAGAVGPVYATDDSSGATTSTQHRERADHRKHLAWTTGDYDKPQPESRADENDGGANAGDCDELTDSTTRAQSPRGTKPTGSTKPTDAGSTDAGSTDAGSTERHNYCSTRDGSPSGNGESTGHTKGKPCAGCVGKADNKNPPGQYPDGTDHNKGYECDENSGIGKTNPAHTGCQSDTVPGAEGDEEAEKPTEETCPTEMPGDAPAERECTPPSTCPAGVDMNAHDCVASATETTPGSPDEVLGAEAQGPAATPASAEVAATSGTLPETGAGRYGIPIAAGLLLLGGGGVLLVRRRLQPGR